MQKRRARARKRGQAALHKTGERRGRAVAAGQRDRIILVVHDRVGPGERIVDVVVGTATADAERVGVRGQRRRPGRRVEDRLAVPARQAVVERGKTRLAGVAAVFAFDANLRVAVRLERRGEKRGFAFVEILEPPTAAIAPHRRGAHGELLIQRLVQVERRAVIAPRTDAELHTLALPVGLRPLSRRGTHAAERAVAEQNRIRPTAKVVALEIETIAVIILREKIPLRPRITRAARRVINRCGEKILHAVVHIERAAGRPLRRALQIRDTQSVDEIARNDGIGHRRVPELSRETATGERTGGGEAVVAFGTHLEG